MTSSRRKDKTRYKIRLKQAAKADHSEYIFRLMMALNNMLSLLVIRDCLSKNSEEPFESGGTRFFLLNLEYGFLVEYLITFVEKIPPGVTNYLSQFPEVAKSFDALKQIIATPEFAKLRTLRNNFIFHLNYQQGGSKTKNGLLQLLKACGNSKKLREQANLIVRSENPLKTRFVTADMLAFECSLMELGIKGNKGLEEFRKFIFNAQRKFIRFAEDATLSWIGHEKLSFDYSECG